MLLGSSLPAQKYQTEIRPRGRCLRQRRGGEVLEHLLALAITPCRDCLGPIRLRTPQACDRTQPSDLATPLLRERAAGSIGVAPLASACPVNVIV